MIFNFIALIAVTALHTWCKWLDIKWSTRMTGYGIRESNSWFRDDRGFFSPVKAWIAVGIITAVCVFWFFLVGHYYGLDSWWPLTSLIIYVISGPRSLFAARHNKRLIEQKGGVL